MSKFKVGDYATIKAGCECITGSDNTPKAGEKVLILSADDMPDYRTLDSRHMCCTAESNLEPITKGDKPMGRRTFKLLKDTPEFRKGTLVQEACDDGNQEYKVVDFEGSHKFDDYDEYGLTACSFSRNTVEQNPTWFTEVFPATETYLTKEEVDAFKAFVKAQSKKAKK